MATVYRQKDRPNWMIAWFDGTGVRRVPSSGTPDRAAAQHLANKLETDSMLRREGVIDPRADDFATGARVELAAHVKKFCQYLRDKGSSVTHVCDRQAQLTRLLEAMSAKRVADLSPARVHRGIAHLRETRKIALRTANRHLVAIKGLTRWRVAENLMASDPLAGLRQFNCDTDRRRERRALTADEVAALVASAESGRDAHGLSGRHRAALYRIAAGTGFRASELASLTPASFDLDGTPPTIVVAAGYSKNRKESVQPIRRDLAEWLRGWLVGKPENAPVFDAKDLRYRTARMMRIDLAVAGIEYIDGDGRVADFHALRHTFITEVVRAGASVKEAQTLARHATPDLTFRVYAHARLHDLTKTLDAMPATASGGASSEEPIALPRLRATS